MEGEYGVGRRFTERHELRRLAAVVEASQDAIFSTTAAGIVESWNAGAERLYGYSAQEIIGTSVACLLPVGRVDAVFDATHAGSEPLSLERRERRKDGTLVDVAVTMSPLGNETGELAGVAFIVHDVTERIRANERLAEAHSLFAGAFDAASTGMALVAPDGGFLAVNPALCQMLGRDQERLLGMSFQELTHPDEVEFDVEQGERILAGAVDSLQLSKRYLLPGGGIVWALVTVTLVRGADARPRYFVAQMQDITDRKTTEAEVDRYAAQLAAASERDPVTGLLNRRAFQVALDEELRIHAVTGQPCSVILAALMGDDSVLVAAADALGRVSRQADPIAYLGGGEIAVLLPGTDKPTAQTVARRARAALSGIGDVRCTHTTSRAADNKETLLGRLRERRSGLEPARLPLAQVVPSSVDRLLELARRQLGMPVSFLTRLDGDSYVFERFGGDPALVGVAGKDGMPLADTYCLRMLDGRIGSVVVDLAAEPETRELHLTRALGLRAYAGVPVRLRSGELFGTFCCVDTHPRPGLTERDAELLRFLSDLVAELIDDDAEQHIARRAEATATSVRTLLAALEARDSYTSDHSKEVVAIASSVARRLGLDEDETQDVEHVALLHDVGKVGIPDSILQKQGSLLTQEWQLMRQHPVVGERIVAGTPGVAHLAPAIRAEHERWDGAGYPDGLAGKQIPLSSRITFACDALHAMTSDRPYRPAMTIDYARQELRSCAGTQFDPRVIDALLAELDARYPISPALSDPAPTADAVGWLHATPA